MQGVEPPRPGRGSRQSTFSVLLHFVGRFVSELIPSFRGPRHCGQFSALAVDPISETAIEADRKRTKRCANRIGRVSLSYERNSMRRFLVWRHGPMASIDLVQNWPNAHAAVVHWRSAGNI